MKKLRPGFQSEWKFSKKKKKKKEEAEDTIHKHSKSLSWERTTLHGQVLHIVQMCITVLLRNMSWVLTDKENKVLPWNGSLLDPIGRGLSDIFPPI